MKRSKRVTPATKKFLDTVVDIHMNEATSAEAAFLTRHLVLATLPHRNPPGNPHVWRRRNGDFQLSIQAGVFRMDEESGMELPLYPFGTIPRLLLFWVTSEALRTQSRRLNLGDSLTDFMRELGLDPSSGGKRGDRQRLKEQMERTFRAIFSFEWKHTYEDGEEGGRVGIQLSKKDNYRFWWNLEDPKQDSIFESWIELDQDFYDAIIAAPIPVDKRALKALRRSPLALDLYAWATYKSYIVNQTGRVHFVPWRSLQEQFGANYAHLKDFKRAAKEALRKIREVSSLVLSEHRPGGLTVCRAPLPIPPRRAKRRRN